MTLKKKIIGLSTITVLGFAIFVIYSVFATQISVGPCHGYEEVGEIQQQITSESEAIQAAQDYYKSIGRDFGLENLHANKVESSWSVSIDPSKISSQDLCLGSVDINKCTGQELKFNQQAVNKNKILMEYQIPC